MPDRLNDSYYRATANGWETQRPLDHALDCDVAVIGGGFTGLSAALACAEKGLKVALLEAQSIGFGASGRNGGVYSHKTICAQTGLKRSSQPAHIMEFNVRS